MASQRQKTSLYPIGKLPQTDLIELLGRAPGEPDRRVIFGPGLGRDAAVIDFGDRYLVAKSDPITFATDEIGWYVMNINANDVACLGARPCWFIATLLLPEDKTDYALVERIFTQLHTAGREIGVSVVGGHTEITHGLDRPIVVGAMFGEVAPERLVRSDGARPGDALLLTKGICVEGTAILAREAADRLGGKVDAAVIKRAAQFLHNPGISIVREAAIVAAGGEVHAMHDPTEGGVATGIYEITEAAGAGATLDAAALPFYPETRTLCAALGLDPLGLIASGSLLAAVAADSAPRLVQTLHDAGISATLIGQIREAPGVVVRDGRDEYPLRRFTRDEIARVFDAP
ncbi:MAG TPA: AIR synthase family protein [Anaerolineae bacterium]|nr:AIR synthase family protein [Anaerolineae bacterium]HQH39229.1 AIR synthase family protein [Anaerolineae bacterium]